MISNLERLFWLHSGERTGQRQDWSQENLLGGCRYHPGKR